MKKTNTNNIKMNGNGNKKSYVRNDHAAAIDIIETISSGNGHHKRNKRKISGDIFKSDTIVDPFEIDEIIDPDFIPEFNDLKVEAALFKRATGIIYRDNNKKELKYIHPDVTAIKFWLSNRLPEKWNEKEDKTREKESFKAFIEKYSKNSSLIKDSKFKTSEV